MKLETLQHVFWRSVRFDPAPDNIEKVFVAQGKLDARARMAVYRNMYWYRQIEALSNCFPRLRETMGAEHFTKSACAYIRQFPSENGALERFGRKLPEFVNRREEPRLVDELCQLEWARMQTLIAPHAPTIATFESVNPATFGISVLRFVEALHTIEASRDAAQLWQTAADIAKEPTSGDQATTNAAGNNQSDEVDEAIKHNANLEGSGSSTQSQAKSSTNNAAQQYVANHAGTFEDARIVIWRKRHSVFHRVLEKDESNALDAAKRGATLAEICALFMEGAQDQQVATKRALDVLRRWISEQWVEAITPQENPT